MKVYNIYLITNLTKTTNNKYVGQTDKPIEQRFKEHIYQANHIEVQHYDTALHKAMYKYGIENFKLELLEAAVPENLVDEREIYYIEKYNSYLAGYNETRGGQGIHGYSHDKETCEKIRKCSLDLWEKLRANPEKLALRNKKISEAQKGIAKSESQKQKLSLIAAQRIGEKNAFFGKHHSAETKKIISETNSISILMCSKDTDEILQEFGSATAAMAWLNEQGLSKNWNASLIIKCCKKKVKTAYGFVWRYKEDKV